jgi:hypothetical protein
VRKRLKILIISGIALISIIVVLSFLSYHRFQMKMEIVKNFYTSYLKSEVEEYYVENLRYPSHTEDVNIFLGSDSSKIELLEYLLEVNYQFKQSSDTLEFYSTGFNGVDNGGQYNKAYNKSFLQSLLSQYDILLLKIPLRHQVELIKDITAYENGKRIFLEKVERSTLIESLGSLLNNYYYNRFGVTIAKDALRAVREDQFLIRIEKGHEGLFNFCIIADCKCQEDALDFSILNQALDSMTTDFDLLYVPISADLSKVIRL